MNISSYSIMTPHLSFNLSESCFSISTSYLEFNDSTKDNQNGISTSESHQDCRIEETFICSIQKTENSKEIKFKSPSEKEDDCKYFTPKIIISDNKKHTKKKVSVTRVDCIRKRIKTHFNKYLLKTLNKAIELLHPGMLLGKLSQKFIADVNIESNKKYMNLPVYQIFTTKFKDSKNLDTNEDVIQRLLSSGNPEIVKLISKPYYKFFEEYLSSEDFIADVDGFKELKGENYSKLVKKFSSEFIDYYLKETPYKRKVLRND